MILTNTSPLHGSTGDYSNPFITELEYIIPTGYTMDEANSYVQSTSTTYISNGAGEVATLLGIQALSMTSLPPTARGCIDAS